MKNLDWKKLLRMEIGSVVMVVVGAIMVLNPDFGSATVSNVLGWLLVGGGAIGLLSGVLGGLGSGTVVSGVVMLCIGIYLLSNPLMLASIIGIALGVLLVSQGAGALRDALRLKRHGGTWIPGMVLAVFMLLAGIKLIVSPLATSRLVMTVVGIILIVCGAGNLIGHFRANKAIEDGDGIIDV